MEVEGDVKDRLPFFDQNIFIFCDGTWCGEDTKTRTNIKLLHEFILLRCRADPERCMYFPGVGVGGPNGQLDYLASGPLAADIKAKCVEVYEHIAKFFKPGDKVWLFGLSRGAFTVRRVAGMINNLGILKFDKGNQHEHHKRCELVFDIFTNGSKEWSPHQENGAPTVACEEFKMAHCHALGPEDPPIHFMGLFDTVGAVGIPTKLGEHFPYEFYDKLVSRSVRNVYQCAAIHDRLLFFQPCSIGRNPEKNLDGYHTQELWVPGCHYDVGRQHFKFGSGFWTRFVGKLRLGSLQIPEILPNHLYADYALDWIVGKMVEEGFPNPDNYWPKLVAEYPTNPRVNDTRWDGDVYDDLIPIYNFSTFKPWIVGERLLPRELTMAHLVRDDAAHPSRPYISRAVDNHRFLYPNAASTHIDVHEFNLPRKIPPTFGTFGSLKGGAAKNNPRKRKRRGKH